MSDDERQVRASDARYELVIELAERAEVTADWMADISGRIGTVTVRELESAFKDPRSASGQDLVDGVRVVGLVDVLEVTCRVHGREFDRCFHTER